MSLKSAIWMVPAVTGLLLVAPSDAEACGGCFVPPDVDTQVTGHNMVFSISMQQTTLYDQITYTGDPAEFAWVLPIAAEADIDTLSDVFFNQLSFDSTVQVVQPPLNCPFFEGCGDDSDASFGSGSSGSGGSNAPSEDGGVDVIAQETVGPYETVQLSSTSADALTDWLESHGYAIPDDIEPIIASYVAEGFDFLAMKLVPGTGVDKMQPVSISIPGASPALPLRMVAAGTGETTTLTLYILADGRYEPSNFPSFTVPEEGVVWNWDESDSNYTELRQQAYDASNGFAWQTEASLDYSISGFRSNIQNVVDFNGPEAAGYTGLDWDEASLKANEELDRMFTGFSGDTVRLTRLRGELSRPALSQDLVLGASDDQALQSTILQTSKSIGKPPACPPPPDCGSGFGDDDDGFDFESPWTGDGRSTGSKGGSGCAVSGSSSSLGGASALLVVAALALARRRRR